MKVKGFPGHRLQHPGASFDGGRGGRALDSDGRTNAWAPFLSPDEADALLGASPKVAVDYAALSAASAAAAGASAWAGRVSLARLLGEGACAAA